MFKSVDPKPNFPKIEEDILRFWEDNKIFEKSLAQTKDGEPFTFYDGPPFATGLPHYGHILASTIKDVIPRYQTMKGKYVRRCWGWDCHGLPIEEIVERMLKISGKKQIEELGIAKFNETCRSKVLEYVSEWKKTVTRIARWTEFDDSYKTMDRSYMESVWWAFKEIHDKGLVYEGRKVLLYCPRCETPVSNFEVAMDNSYKDVTEEAVTVKFKIKDQDNTYLLAWTTTPWTLPGNVALAVGKDIDYVKVKNNEEFFIVAKDRLSVIASGSEAISKIKGKDLIGFEYEPLFEIPEMAENKNSYKVYAADFVNTEEGTGIVHTAVVYGEDDYALGIKESLPVVPLLDEKGRFNEKSPEFIRGQYFKDAEKFIKKDLEERGLFFERKMHQHSYPHCWRCGNVLFYNAIPAWFIDIQKIKKKLLSSNKKQINWYPEHLKHGRYEKSVEAAPDWNISRNRYWGNPIPVWKCADCGKNTVIGSIAELEKKAMSGFKSDMDLHRPYIDEVIVKCDHCGKAAQRITEIFDSWVEAGSMPFAELHYPFENKDVFESRFPAQFVAEYIAQTRAWFYVMHVISEILFKKAPFENVVTTGTILAEDGSKMSKSKNNYPDPALVMEKYGVDSLRFYLMNSVVMQADNLNFSEKDLATSYRKIVLILWNVYNYFVSYANEANWEFNIQEHEQLLENPKNLLDEWILTRLQDTTLKLTEYLDDYDTVHATRELESFVNELSTWYLRRSRGRNDEAFFATMYRCLITVSKLAAPVMPYISEVIYKNLRLTDHAESVHLTTWPEAKKLSKKHQEILVQMQELRKIVEEVHALRAKAGIKLRQPLARLTVSSKLPAGLLDILKDEVNVKEIAYGENLALDTKLDAGLKLEGLTAELTRQIQSLRKELGMRIGEMADLYYETDSDMIKKAITLVDKKKTYLTSVQSGIKDMTAKETQIEGNILRLCIQSTQG
ncbi:MAG: hypothetical protein A3C85_04750 [Candidatus Doudnabacteria bacterium RIFCSPHIGHO2_02_FULL_48_21]|nr:MAG: hypothetical protein A2668_01530 [Candidatus Doudnabacteria bacterium RIFCSPHIGHO2_01_FULL_48_180]OGE90960.1 MAG: hypothetical protein A3F44_03580 [Candidatus Doudnabacteria bacterium RIFCSPHIGHO2_12_FULL_47_25]OGE92813.1 MAG: hypothetical protein A3C85_04750 [Candidatus Doudnabacteria bacterium RIFCSPHIGHO2_02_FULL_48_21]OGF00895.1 MAG: hypothetical protein A3G07_00150 [Candidatus Doudnabacteria bacterium RIFCSPLOWO2_12_FULL_47_12]